MNKISVYKISGFMKKLGFMNKLSPYAQNQAL
jgi:hypothetical protein